MRHTLMVLMVCRLFRMGFAFTKTEMVSEADALKGRDTPLSVPDTHAVNQHNIKPPFPDGTEIAMFGMGCFWGAERLFWTQPGVYSTMVGYTGGYTRNPKYEEVCSGTTGHTEVVRVVFDPQQVAYQDLLVLFWENHDPTMGMRQGYDMGTQYRSAIYTYGDDQMALALASRDAFQAELRSTQTLAHAQDITTEILPAKDFYYAEDYHQQYLHKNPGGYCGLRGVGATCPREIKPKCGCERMKEEKKNESKTEDKKNEPKTEDKKKTNDEL